MSASLQDTEGKTERCHKKNQIERRTPPTSPFINQHCQTKCFLSVFTGLPKLSGFLQWEIVILIKKMCFVVFRFFFLYSKEGIWVNKDCASEIRCRVSFAVLSVSSAVLVLPQLQWELTITIFFFSLQMDLWDLEVWKLLPSPSIKHYLSSFSQRELQETQIHLPQ